MTHLSVNLLSPESLIQSFGLIGIYTMIFAETGLLVGFSLRAIRCFSSPASPPPPPR